MIVGHLRNRRPDDAEPEGFPARRARGKGLVIADAGDDAVSDDSSTVLGAFCVFFLGMSRLPALPIDGTFKLVGCAIGMVAMVPGVVLSILRDRLARRAEADSLDTSV